MEQCEEAGSAGEASGGSTTDHRGGHYPQEAGQLRREAARLQREIQKDRSIQL